jgi:hypothetical protein
LPFKLQTPGDHPVESMQNDVSVHHKAELNSSIMSTQHARNTVTVFISGT